MLLLVPKDPLGSGPDDHFAAEYEAAKRLGVAVALLDDDSLRAGDAAGATSRVPPSDDVVYRGWMLKSEDYAALEAALATRGAALRTTAKRYQRAHELPGWLPFFVLYTPRSEICPADPDGPEFAAALKALDEGGAVLKDYVKSEKHHWDEAAFIPDVADVAHARAVAHRFLELRGPDLVGGLVLRRYCPLQGDEVRSWWVDGQLVHVGPHPDTPQASLQGAPLRSLTPSVRCFSSPFLTVDLARRAQGGWLVVEVGDGQVSDRPASLTAEELVKALATARPAEHDQS